MALAGIESKKMDHDVDTNHVNDEEEVMMTMIQDNKKQVDDEIQEGFVGPKLITFDGDQTLYSDGANFESNRQLAHYMYLLLKNGVTVAVVTAAGYEYEVEKYEHRLSGLLRYFQEKKLSSRDCERFYLFGGECNYLLQVCVCCVCMCVVCVCVVYIRVEFVMVRGRHMCFISHRYTHTSIPYIITAWQ